MERSQRTPASARLALARRRARARKQSAGAAMFIVAVTLGLLAVMGVYGLTATAADVRAAGHMREGLQAQKTAEHSLITTAETLTPTKADGFYSAMTSNAAGAVQNNQGGSRNCKTAAAYTGNTETRFSEACVRLSLTELAAQAPLSKAPYTTQSFGYVQNNLNAAGADGIALAGTESNSVQVEITNPFRMTPVGTTSDYAQVTVTTFTTLAPALNTPPTTVVSGRGRMTVGPLSKAVANY